MADQNIKKIIINKQDLPSIDGQNFKYNVRFRVSSDDKNKFSSWSSFYNVDALNQEVITESLYTWSVDTLNKPGATTTKVLKLNWEPRVDLKLNGYDVFVSREIVGKVNGGLSSGATSVILHDIDSNIKVGQLIIDSASHLATGTHVTAVSGNTITFSPATTGTISNNSLITFYNTNNAYITNIDRTQQDEKIASGKFIFTAENSFLPGELITITGASPSEFNGTFEVLKEGLTSTQFALSIFSDLTLWEEINGTFTWTPSQNAISNRFVHYLTTAENNCWIIKNNNETEAYVRVQQLGFPKTARKRLILFQTEAIDIT
jgi:hypothetical protein